MKEGGRKQTKRIGRGIGREERIEERRELTIGEQ